jgi:sugar lactone lactonase YvrE
VKHFLYLVLLIAVFACVFPSCSKTGIRPGKQHNPGDSSVATRPVDTLPSFYNPTGVAVDAGGNVYVADYGNNLIRKITPGGVVSTFAGSGTQGSINANSILASFNEPRGIAVDASGNVYVADAGNNLIRKITVSGQVSTIAGADSSFSAPSGIAVDASGNVYVADAGNGLMRKITPAGVVSTLSGPSGGLFNNPTGVAVDAGDNVFVANFLDNTIYKISPQDSVTLYAGSGFPGADNGPAASASFYYPSSVAVDTAHNLYVADGVNNLIRKITPNGIVSTLAGSGQSGAVDSTGVNASFNGPSGLAVDMAGNVYVADTNNNSIRKITPDGKVTTIAGSGKAGSKDGVTVAGHHLVSAEDFRRNYLKLWYR